MDLDEDHVLKLLSNQIRRRILSELVEKDGQRFSDLMRGSQLDPNSDTGLFLYHIHRLSRVGAIQGVNGSYRISATSRAMMDRLTLLTQTNHGVDDKMNLDEISSEINWEAYRTSLPKIKIDSTDEEFKLRKGSVIGGVGPGRLDLLDVVDINEKIYQLLVSPPRALC